MQSSQTSNTGLSQTSNDTLPRPLYRPPKPIPYELREHSVIYFEEELCKPYPPCNRSCLGTIGSNSTNNYQKTRHPSIDPPPQPPRSRHFHSLPDAPPGLRAPTPTPRPSRHPRRAPFPQHARPVRRASAGFQPRAAPPPPHAPACRACERRLRRCVRVHVLQHLATGRRWPEHAEEKE